MLLKNRFVFLFVSAILSMLSPALFSQVKVNAQLDSNSILIGEQTKIHITVNYKATDNITNILWPSLSDTIIKQIEIVSKTKIDTTIPDRENNELQQSQTLTITSFDSGYYAIPPFKFILNGDSNKVFETEALLLAVNTIPIDTTIAIRDIKPPIEEPFDFRELLPYIYWGLGIAAAIIAVIYLTLLYLRKHKHKPVVKEEPSLPPDVIALQALEKLREEKLWQEGKTKQYYTGISEIIRNYIELRFKVNALEQTTDEILLQFRSLVVDNESKNKLRQLLTMADLVKFAKSQPIASENEMCLTHAVEFVNGTKREEVIQPDTPNELNNNSGA